MHRLTVFWLPLALAVLITNQCAIALLTMSQLKQIVTEILFEDELYNDVLSEKVKLDKKTNLPPRVHEVVKDLDNVDPLVSLHALIPHHQYYSLDNLELSLTIVSESLACLMYKRVAFHLALMIHLFENYEDKSIFLPHLRMFEYAFSFYINMLFSISKNYEHLLKVYDAVHSMISSPINRENTINILNEQLTNLDKIIESSCVVHEMKLYCKSFNLEKLKNCEEQITDKNTISQKLKGKITKETLNENVNAILNFYDEMDLLRSVDMGAWNVWLRLTPDLPPVQAKIEFKRTALPKFRHEVEKIIEARECAIEKEKELAKIKLEQLTEAKTSSVKVIKNIELSDAP